MKKGLYEVLDVYFRDYVTKQPVFIFDTLKMSGVEITGESNPATGGKGNPELFHADHSRRATLNLTDALISMTSLALLAGKNGPTKGSKIITKREDVKLNNLPGGTPGVAPTGGSLTVTQVASTDGSVSVVVGTETYSAAITTTMSLDDTASAIADAINLTTSTTTSATATGPVVNLVTTRQLGALTVVFNSNTTGALATTTDFSGGSAPLPPASVTITLKHTPQAGSVYYVDSLEETVVPIADAQVSGLDVELTGLTSLQGSIIYQTLAAKTKIVTISSDQFPGYFEVEGSTMEIDACSGEFKEFIVRIPKAKLGSNFTIELNSESTPAEFAFTLTAMKECNATDLVEFIEVEEY